MMRLLLSPRVAADLEEIGDYIARDSPFQAIRFIRLIHARIKEISGHPEVYRLRPEIGEDARLATMGHYVIQFRIRRGTVRVERVVHGSRDLIAMLEEPEE